MLVAPTSVWAVMSRGRSRVPAPGRWEITVQATLKTAQPAHAIRVQVRAIVNAFKPWVKSLLSSIDTPPTKETVKHVISHIIVLRVHDAPHAYILQELRWPYRVRDPPH